MPTKRELGQKLRVARFERNLTLKEVARRCGMSATHISEVERGKTSPTIGALQRIAAALGEKPSYFVQEDELPRVKLTRAAERCSYYMTAKDAKPVSVEVVSPGIPGGFVQLFRKTTPSGERTAYHARIGEAVITCMRGMVRVTAGDETHVLREGDTVQLRLDDGFTGENIGDEDSEIVAVLAAPVLIPV